MFGIAAENEPDSLSGRETRYTKKIKGRDEPPFFCYCKKTCQKLNHMRHISVGGRVCVCLSVFWPINNSTITSYFVNKLNSVFIISDAAIEVVDRPRQ